MPHSLDQLEPGPFGARDRCRVEVEHSASLGIDALQGATPKRGVAVEPVQATSWS